MIDLLLIQNSRVSTEAERYLLVYMLFVLLAISSLIIIFFVIFQKRKNKLLLGKIKQQQEFEEEISKTQLEVQEQTLKNIGWELHDNVGQLLSFAGMQMNLLTSQVDDTIKEKISDTNDIIKKSIQEVRALSKVLNSDVILNQGLKQSVQNEIDRLNKLKKINASLEIKGEEVTFSKPKDEIILFRIIQEFLSNSVKYSEAGSLSIILNYTDDNLQIKAKDDGKGFDSNSIERGSGLINMKSRADLINTEFDIKSQIGNGVELTLNYPLR